MQASALRAPHSTGPAMEWKVVCALLCVLLLVSCSLQQTPPKKKLMRKGRLHIAMLRESLDIGYISNHLM